MFGEDFDKTLMFLDVNQVVVAVEIAVLTSAHPHLKVQVVSRIRLRVSQAYLQMYGPTHRRLRRPPSQFVPLL